MTSKSLFFRLTLENLKRRIWALALGFLVFFFSLPVAVAFIFSQKVNNAYPELSLWRIQKEAIAAVTMEWQLMTVIVVTAALICGVSSFAYLHSKNKVDFYHGIPVRRETLFWISYVSGILIMASVYAVNLLIAMAIIAANGVTADRFVMAAFAAFGQNMVYYLLLYTASVAAMMLTGNVIVGILMNLVINIWGPAVLALTTGYFSEFFQTYYVGSDSFFNRAIPYSSPFAIYMNGFAAANEVEPEIGTAIAAALAVTAALAALSLIMYRLRPSEAAGKAMAFKITQAPIKFLLVVPLGLASALIFEAWGDSDGWMIFGLLSGLFISHGIIEIIYSFEFRKALAKKRQFCVCAASAAAILAVFRLDLAGYDSYLPDASKVASAAVCIYGVDDWVDYRTVNLAEAEYPSGKSSLSFEYEGDVDHIFKNMAITDPADVLALAGSGIQEFEKRSREEIDRASMVYEEAENGAAVAASDANSQGNFYRSVYIQYRLKSGRTVRRGYYVNLADNREIVDRICENPQYREGVFPIFGELGQETVGINFRSLAGDVRRVADGDETAVAAIVAAYQREFGALTMEQRRNEAPMATLVFKTEAAQEISDRLKAEKNNSWTDLNDFNEYPLYPSFTETIALMEKAGVEAGWGFDMDDVESLTVEGSYPYGYEDESGEQKTADGKPYSWTFTDRDQIEELLAYAIPSIYENMDPLFFRGMNAQAMSVKLKSGVRDNESGDAPQYLFHIPFDKIPDFVRDQVALTNDIGYSGF